jgi:hypothetical protein
MGLFAISNGRGDWIRTSGLSVPNRSHDLDLVESRQQIPDRARVYTSPLDCPLVGSSGLRFAFFRGRFSRRAIRITVVTCPVRSCSSSIEVVCGCCPLSRARSANVA